MASKRKSKKTSPQPSPSEPASADVVTEAPPPEPAPVQPTPAAEPQADDDATTEAPPPEPAPVQHPNLLSIDAAGLPPASGRRPRSLELRLTPRQGEAVARLYAGLEQSDDHRTPRRQSDAVGFVLDRLADALDIP